MEGNIDHKGTVNLSWTLDYDKLYSPDGLQHCLPCETCGQPQWVGLLTVSVLCDRCADGIRCSEHAHSSIDGRCEL